MIFDSFDSYFPDNSYKHIHIGYKEHNCRHKYSKLHSGLTEVPDDIPEETNVVKLKRNNIATLKSGNFSHMYSCLFLDLSFNNISLIEPDAFEGLDSLYTMWLSNNSLQILTSGMFQQLKNLEKLYLSGNRIASIEANSFSELQKLLILDLSHNLLSSLVDGSLSGLTALKELHIDGNRFTTLDAIDAFQDLPRPLTLAVSSPSSPESTGNIFDCNYLVCWLKHEEKAGNITWYESGGKVYRPRCSSKRDWNEFNWNCTHPSKIFFLKLVNSDSGFFKLCF